MNPTFNLPDTVYPETCCRGPADLSKIVTGRDRISGISRVYLWKTFEISALLPILIMVSRPYATA